MDNRTNGIPLFDELQLTPFQIKINGFITVCMSSGSGEARISFEKADVIHLVCDSFATNGAHTHATAKR